jgi:hypothetical protein
MNADLQTFVRESLARGIPRPAIVQKLHEAGWRTDETDAAMAFWHETEFPVPVPRRRPYLSAREAFLYLVLFATLYATAFNTGAVLFAFLDRAMPDASNRWESAERATAAARGATAGLIIGFPIFLMLSSVIGRSIRRDPEKRVSKIRKWLTYLTLFVAAMVMIGDLTFLVSRLLSGELPGRVLLKTLVVLAISGMVFSHYLADLRADEREGSGRSLPRVPPWLAAALVAAVLGVGLVMSGSPIRERQRRLDAERVSDLQAISSHVTSWTREHRRLPASLDELAADPTASNMRFRDPLTGRPYEYRPLGGRAYELCGVFDTADSADTDSRDRPGGPSRFWAHGPGRGCYRLEVPANVPLSGPPPTKALPR